MKLEFSYIVMICCSRTELERYQQSTMCVVWRCVCRYSRDGRQWEDGGDGRGNKLTGWHHRRSARCDDKRARQRPSHWQRRYAPAAFNLTVLTCMYSHLHVPHTCLIQTIRDVSAYLQYGVKKTTTAFSKTRGNIFTARLPPSSLSHAVSG